MQGLENNETVQLKYLQVVTATDVGQVRELNEDTVWGSELTAGEGNPWQLSAVLVVADGMGGHQAGEVASSLAVQTVREVFVLPRTQLAGEELVGQQWLHRISESLQYINRVVHTQSGGNGISRPGTTLTVCLARENEYAVGHVGDSRAYLIRRDEIEQVTQDDSLVAEAVRRGQMTEEEARTSQFRNQITKAVGLQPEIVPSVYYGHWREGDILLLCSDGLTEYVVAEELLQLAGQHQDLEQLCQILIALANQRGGHDNISVAAARYAVPAQALAAPSKPQTLPPTQRAALGLDELGEAVPSQISLEDRRAQKKRRLYKEWIWLGSIVFLLALAAGWWSARKAPPQRERVGRIAAPTPVPPPASATIELSFTLNSDNKPDGIQIYCWDLAVVQLQNEEGRSALDSPRFNEMNLGNGQGRKIYVKFKDIAATNRLLDQGASFRLYRATDLEKEDPSPPLERKEPVVVIQAEGWHSVFLTRKNGQISQKPLVTFQLKALPGREEEN